jgi:hypothetical protein
MNSKHSALIIEDNYLNNFVFINLYYNKINSNNIFYNKIVRIVFNHSSTFHRGFITGNLARLTFRNIEKEKYIHTPFHPNRMLPFANPATGQLFPAHGHAHERDPVSKNETRSLFYSATTAVSIHRSSGCA